MIRFALITLVVSTTLPFVTALADTADEPEVTPTASVEVVTPVLPAAAPPEPITPPSASVEGAPASSPATASVAPPTATAPTPVEPASAGLPAAAPVILPPPAPAPSPAAAPNVPPATPSAKRRTATKSPTSRAPRSVTVVNGRDIPARTITVLTGTQAVSHAGPLAPQAQSVLKLPKMKGCLVTVEVTYEGGSVSDGSAIDVCRVKLVRLTD